ncbi:hypothetical protein Hanom_Chr01g00063181 [Helianthus anomalus]
MISCCDCSSWGVSLEAASLFLRGRGKAVYILPSSDPTLALLLVGFTEYDDYYHVVTVLKCLDMCVIVVRDQES